MAFKALSFLSIIEKRYTAPRTHTRIFNSFNVLKILQLHKRLSALINKKGIKNRKNILKIVLFSPESLFCSFFPDSSKREKTIKSIKVVSIQNLSMVI
ncbi:MAG TPA: hypothetical protein PLP52_05230 [Syntrophorhabdaceae bacterium]|nr:hypothetical protein [Syntrophorhabdaceae bacterium]